MEELGSLFVALALLILLAVTSMRFGVDSREGFRGRRGGFVPLGIVWDVSPSRPRPAKAVPKEQRRLGPAPADCRLESCAA
jgi:hypothetical protein